MHDDKGFDEGRARAVEIAHRPVNGPARGEWDHNRRADTAGYRDGVHESQSLPRRLRQAWRSPVGKSSATVVSVVDCGARVRLGDRVAAP
ncbi:MAG: hypothetical protein ACO3JL_16785, partial [Myxococcota bacterium]